MMVKICGITNAADAIAAAESGAAAVGFVFWPKSPRYVTPAQVALITAQLPASVLKVGVFVDEKPREIDRIAADAGLDVAQLHGNESPSRVPRSVRIWKAFRVTADWSPEGMSRYPAEAFLLDSAAHGNTFEWKRAQGLGHRIVLAGGLDATNVREAVAVVHPWGVDASSRLERRPGIKDHEKMRRFIDEALSTCI